jgi:hypothetical protein
MNRRAISAIFILCGVALLVGAKPSDQSKGADTRTDTETTDRFVTVDNPDYEFIE